MKEFKFIFEQNKSIKDVNFENSKAIVKAESITGAKDKFKKAMPKYKIIEIYQIS